MGVCNDRDPGRAPVLEPAFVTMQLQYQAKSQPRSQHHRQPQHQRQAQFPIAGGEMEAGPSQQNLTEPQTSNMNFMQSPPRSLTRRRRSPMPQLPPINTTMPRASELERVPTEPMPSSPPMPPSPAQPTPKMLLERYGIKVRDFAYESKLPPVPTVPRLPPPRDLARRREYGNWFGRPPPEPMSEEMRKKRQELSMPKTRPTTERDLQAVKELERRPTEPILENSQETTAPTDTTYNMILASARGLFPRVKPMTQTENDDQGPFSQGQFFQSQNLFGSQYQHQHHPYSQPSESSQPPLVGCSQADSEMDGLETPLITPDASQMDIEMGGLTDSSALPESQVAQLLSNSQLPPQEDVSVSQMGLIGESQASDSRLESQTISNAMESAPHSALSVNHPIASSALAGTSLVSNSTPLQHSATPFPVSITHRTSSIASHRSVSTPAVSPLISRHPTGFGTGLVSRKRSFSQASLSSLSSLSRRSSLSHEDMLATSTSNKRRNGPSRENEPVPRLSQDFNAHTVGGADGVVGTVGRYNLRKARRTETSGVSARSLASPTRFSPQKSFDARRKAISRTSAHAAKKGNLIASPSPKARGRSHAGAKKKPRGIAAESALQSPTKKRARRTTRI